MLKVAFCAHVCKTCRSARQLVLCVWSMPKVTMCICLCIRPVEVSSSLSFVSFYSSRIYYSSKTCHRTVVNISQMAVRHQVSYGHYQGGNYLLYCQLLINLSVVVIPLATPCTRAHVVVNFGCACQLVFWGGCYTLPGSLWG